MTVKRCLVHNVRHYNKQQVNVIQVDEAALVSKQRVYAAATTWCSPQRQVATAPHIYLSSAVLPFAFVSSSIWYRLLFLWSCFPSSVVRHLSNANQM